jgi:Beta protein
MRRIKSGGKVVYTYQGNWYVRKGGAFRDNPAQMHDHCKYIVDSGKFLGAGFSEGDAYIERCANKTARPSNQPFWKQVAISHHIMHVLEDLAKLDAAA